MVTRTALSCPKCQQAFAPPPEAAAGIADSRCPRCHTTLTLTAFPRLTAQPAEAAPDTAGSTARDGDAVCRFYPHLQAETVCAECGCLMSRRAAVDWAGRTLCMPCLHTLRETKGAGDFSPRRPLHDNAALGLVVLLAPLSFVTGPIALFQLIRHRRAPGSLIPRSRFRWWLALILSIAATLGWIALFITWIVIIVQAVTA